jgi:hypothetical protein
VPPSVHDRRSWAVFWTKHSLITKMFVVTLLTGSLFRLLYWETAFEKIVVHRDESFWISRGRDAATLAYTGLAGMIHFFLCYVSSMYTFSALQIGAIAGKQAKNLFSQYVHLVVAVLSGSMIVMGVIKSTLVHLVQWIVWQVYGVSQALPSPPNLPEVVVTTLNAIFNAFSPLLSFAERFMLESNFVGRGCLSIFDLFSSVFNKGMAKWSSFVDDAVRQYQHTGVTVLWREQVFVTARALFTYSAVFLLVLLFLFGLSAMYARHEEEASNDTDQQNPEPDEKRPTALTVDSSAKNQRNKRRLQPPAFHTIKEDTTFIEPTPNASWALGTASESNSKERRVRFRGGKLDSSST